MDGSEVLAVSIIRAAQQSRRQSSSCSPLRETENSLEVLIFYLFETFSSFLWLEYVT
jgi:hypothetical protein